MQRYQQIVLKKKNKSRYNIFFWALFFFGYDINFLGRSIKKNIENPSVWSYLITGI